MRRIQVFTDLITQRQQEELHALTIAVRHSQGTDGKVLDKFLKSLVKDEE